MQFWWSTTAVSASSQASRGPAALEEGIVASLFGADQDTRHLSLRQRALMPCRRSTDESRKLANAAFHDRAPLGSGGREGMEAAWAPTAVIGGRPPPRLRGGGIGEGPRTTVPRRDDNGVQPP